MSSSIFAALAKRLTVTLTPQNGLITLLIYGVFFFILALIIFGAHPSSLHLHNTNLKRTWSFWLLSPLYFVIPSLGEEIVFRGLAQPRRLFGGTSRAWAFSGLSLLAFILWHPFQVWLHLPSAQAVFLEPIFLMIVALLGLSTTLLTHATGSLWPGVILHGLLVISWKALSP